MSKISILCTILVVALASTGYGVCDPNNCVVIGDWEQQSDGWIDWGNKEPIDSPNNMPGKYQYEPDFDVTLGDWSLHLNQCGWNQNLAINLNSTGHVDDFFANKCFCFDVSVPGLNDESGWCEIYEVVLNAEGYGWHGLNGVPVIHWDFWPGVGDRHATVCLDYSEAFDTIAENPGWIEFIITTNSDSVHCDFYFDNARLCIPEPTTIALLGLGSLALLRRKRA